ncbi:hypothetical protein COOONC_02322 [Cooperia oncophora]
MSDMRRADSPSAYYCWTFAVEQIDEEKRSHTIDVLVRNSVKNFELSTAVSSKTPLFPPSSPANIADDSVSREDRPRPRPYFPVVKFPNMLDVNFRRRPGTKTVSIISLR